ncbi:MULTISPECIES: hypothetical protein [unclassified Streptomyces]|nr:hypothetical protein [Streptomyces sp. NBC_00223]
MSDESTELRFVAPGELAALPMHRTQRLMIGRERPWTGRHKSQP